MADSVKLLFLSGSTREGSFNSRLALAAKRVAEARDHDAEMISLANYPMPLYNGDLEQREGQPEAAIRLLDDMKPYTGIFIAGPEYNASITPLLKNTIDWLSRIKSPDGSFFKTRVFAIGAASPGGLGGMRRLITLRQVLTLGLGAMVLPEQIAVGGAGTAFDEDGALIHERSRTMLNTLIDKLAFTALRLYT